MKTKNCLRAVVAFVTFAIAGPHIGTLMRSSPYFVTIVRRNAIVIMALSFSLAGFSQNSPETNSSSALNESWLSISNRWSGLPVEKTTQAAESNNVSAQYYLATTYYEGNGIVSKDLDRSFNWMSKAAAQGMPRAQRKLAFMYLNGEGVEASDLEAARYCRMAADGNDLFAENLLGWLYQNGRGVPDDQHEAVKWYQKAAEQGQPKAQMNLAYIYGSGAYGTPNTFGQGAEAQVKSGGIAPNHELAEMWMKKAVDLNSAEGQFKYAEFLYGEFDDHGYQDTTKFPEAALWYKKAAEQNYAPAQYELAEMYHTGKLGDDQRSNCIPWFLKAAAQGNADAQAVVGNLKKYYPQNDLLTSVDPVTILLRSAKSGNFDAQFQLANRYQSGDGVPKDPAEAFGWMQKASQNGQTTSSVQGDALYRLALMYEKGEGVQQDLVQTTNLIIQAAEGFNQPDAEYRVGQMYEKGQVLPQDDYLAVRSYFLAMTAFNGREFKYQATEQLLKLYSEGRGISKTTQGPDAYEDHTLKNKSTLLEYFQGMIKTARAQLYAGEIYYQGKLVPKDLVTAAAWFQLAAGQNLDEANKILGQVESEMSSAQKDAAKKKQNDLEQHIRSSN